MRIARSSSLQAFGLSSSCVLIYTALRTSVLVAAVFQLSGCATLITGTSQKVRFDSTPPGAEVIVNGVPSGTTPTTITMHRDGETIVTFRKGGYEPQAMPLQTGIEPSFWIDIVLLSPIGIVVDISDRADLTFSQVDYATTLKQSPLPGSEPDGQREKEIRSYIGENYQALGQEVRKLEGEHLGRLIEMLYVAADGRPRASKILQNAYYMNHSESTFADAVVVKFGVAVVPPPIS